MVTDVDVKPIIFFDGVCGLCNRFVDWVLARDKKDLYRFAPLQGETAREKLGELPGPFETWSITFLDHEGRWQESTAVLRIVAGLGGLGRAAGLFLWVPPLIRDGLYRWIAKNRYNWFGKRATCRLPTPKERERFLP